MLSLFLGRELADATLYGSQDVRPDVLAGDGFQFEETEVEPAMASALGTR